MFTAATMKAYKGDKPWTEKQRVERIAKIHRIFGYIMLFLGNWGIWSGLSDYYQYKLYSLGGRVNWGSYSMILFLILVITFEVIYRLRNKYSKGQIKTPGVQGKIQSFTPKSIDDEVAKGRKLVIFDNLVLELHEEYIHLHPGGKFNLVHNLGRDISKFFFGGYNLVNTPGVIKRPHHHSQAALDIVKTFVIGVIEGQEQV